MNNDPVKIVLVDDDESDRLTFKDAIEELKIKTTLTILNDGVLLMEYLAKEDTPVPELLFLDLNMPRKGGIECLKEIRKIEKFNDLAIAIYSTSSSQSDIETTFVTGANVYITKPSNYSELKRILDKVVRSANLYRHPPFNMATFVLCIS